MSETPLGWLILEANCAIAGRDEVRLGTYFIHKCHLSLFCVKVLNKYVILTHKLNNLLSPANMYSFMIDWAVGSEIHEFRIIEIDVIHLGFTGLN